MIRIGPWQFQPTFWASVVAGLGIVLMLGLGTWQVQRLTWKNQLIQTITDQMALPPQPLPQQIDDTKSWSYRRVQVTGRFLHDRELYLGARSMHGSIGFQILTPLQRDDGGGFVLVNRGWVPTERRAPGARLEGQIEGTVTIQGVARIPVGHIWPQPDNRPDENFWFWFDLPAMAAKAEVPSLFPMIVEADATANPGGFPIGGQTRISLPNDHLGYALTWYSLAIGLLAVYVVYHTRRV